MAVLVLIALMLVAAPVSAATRYVRSAGPNTTGPADSCSSADVQAAIDAAVSGDTVQIGAGSCTWTNGVTNTYNAGSPTFGAYDTIKWIKIYGAGTLPLRGATPVASGGTQITDNIPAATAGCVILLREATGGNVEVANITLVLVDGYSKFSRICWEPGSILAGVAGAKVHYMHHMTFTDNRDPSTGNEGTPIKVSTGRGVMSRNKFVRAKGNTAHEIFNCILNNNTWATPSTFGDRDTDGDLNFYFEDNETYNSQQSEFDNRCRGVWRGNYSENTTLTGHGKDSQSEGVRHMEFYNNTWKCDGDGTTTNLQAYVGHRGGVEFAFNNTMDAIVGSCRVGSPQAPEFSTGAWILQVRDETHCFLKSDGTAGVYPAPNQFGWGYITGATSVDRYYYANPSPDTTLGHDTNGTGPGGVYLQDLERSYFWNNYRPDGTTKITSDGTTADGGINVLEKDDTCLLGQTQAAFIQENREWFKQAPIVGGTCAQGAAACTAGIGQGARSQRPANCTVGVAWWSTDQGGNWNTTNGSANDGTLDKCTATNTWTNAYYTPFVYPHTLASVTGTGTGTVVVPVQSQGNILWRGNILVR